MADPRQFILLIWPRLPWIMAIFPPLTQAPLNNNQVTNNQIKKHIVSFPAACPFAGETQPAPDSFSQVYQRRLSNGIRINYRKTDFEPCSGLMRLAAPGGRMAENMGVGPDGFGAVVVGELGHRFQSLSPPHHRLSHVHKFLCCFRRI